MNLVVVERSFEKDLMSTLLVPGDELGMHLKSMHPRSPSTRVSILPLQRFTVKQTLENFLVSFSTRE